MNGYFFFRVVSKSISTYISILFLFIVTHPLPANFKHYHGAYFDNFTNCLWLGAGDAGVYKKWKSCDNGVTWTDQNGHTNAYTAVTFDKDYAYTGDDASSERSIKRTDKTAMYPSVDGASSIKNDIYVDIQNQTMLANDYFIQAIHRWDSTMLAFIQANKQEWKLSPDLGGHWYKYPLGFTTQIWMNFNQPTNDSFFFDQYQFRRMTREELWHQLTYNYTEFTLVDNTTNYIINGTLEDNEVKEVSFRQEIIKDPQIRFKAIDRNNILNNSDFENGTIGGMPTYWGAARVNQSNTSAVAQLINTGCYNGNNCMFINYSSNTSAIAHQITFREYDGTNFGWFYPKNCSSYMMSFYAKGDDTSFMIILDMPAFNASGSSLASIGLQSFSVSSNWTRHAMNFTTASGKFATIYRAYPTFAIHSSSYTNTWYNWNFTIYLDALQLECVDSFPRPVLAPYVNDTKTTASISVNGIANDSVSNVSWTQWYPLTTGIYSNITLNSLINGTRFVSYEIQGTKVAEIRNELENLDGGYIKPLSNFGNPIYMVSNQTAAPFKFNTWKMNITPQYNINLTNIVSTQSTAFNFSLTGAGSTNIVIDSGDSSKTGTVTYDGITCSLNCIINSNLGGIVDFTVTGISKQHNLTLTMLAGTNGTTNSTNYISDASTNIKSAYLLMAQIAIVFVIISIVGGLIFGVYKIAQGDFDLSSMFGFLSGGAVTLIILAVGIVLIAIVISIAMSIS